MKWLTVVATVAALAFTNAAFAHPLSGPRNVLLSRNRTEPTIAIDPLHPQIVVATANTDYSQPQGGRYPTAFFASRDGGASFTSGSAPMVSPYTTGADTTVQITDDGTVFYSYLGETPSYCAGGTSAVVVAHSVDHGSSYRSPVVVDANGADDKPNMAVESLHSRSAHVFLTWSRYHGHASDVWYSRSVDGGKSFEHAKELYSSHTDNFGTVPVVGPHGRMYVFWSVFPEFGLSTVVPTRLVMMVSTDDGQHFSRPRTVVRTFNGMPQMVQPGSLRSLTMPAVAVSPGGTLYLSWAAVSHDSGRGVVRAAILVKRSTNGGVSWSKPVTVNDASAGDRFMPSIAYLGRSEVGIAFYDRRRGSGRLDVYGARVSWSGTAYGGPNVRLNAHSSFVSDIYYLSPSSTCFSPGRFFGDYFGVAADRNGAFCVVWADTQLGVQDETDVWFARVGLPSRERRLPHNGVSTQSRSGIGR